MLTLEELRRRSLLKLIIISISLIIPLTVVLVMSIGDFDFSKNSFYNIWEPYSHSFPYILLASFYIWLIYKVVDYSLILKSNEYAEKKIRYKNDERIRYIYMFTNSLASKIYIYVLSVSILFASFIKQEYFWPLICAFGLHWVIQISVYLYYRNKI